MSGIVRCGAAARAGGSRYDSRLVGRAVREARWTGSWCSDEIVSCVPRCRPRSDAARGGAPRASGAKAWSDAREAGRDVLGTYAAVTAALRSGTIQRASKEAAHPVAAEPAPRIRRADRDGRLPEEVQAGVEQLSGLSLDDVRVHYNSPRPGRLNAGAYTQGTEIFVGPGEERHLPHEAWHVVQQAQGRVRPMIQMKERAPVNDDRGLEHEADVMGARALRTAPRPTSSAVAPAPLAMGRPVIQLAKWVINSRTREVKKVDDGYNKTPIERWCDEHGNTAPEKPKRPKKKKVVEETEEEKRVREERALAAEAAERERREAAEKERLAKEAQARRRKKREEHKARVAPSHLPKATKKKQMKFPRVVEKKESGTVNADLAYRGMSVNNIRNMQQNAGAVFTAQNPTGTASAVQHIAKDDPNSPWLSFEVGGFDVSAGKYAAKPVNPETNVPYGVTKKEGGFLKQEKSYAAESRRKYPRAKRMGYVGGIKAGAGTERLDVSDKRKADAYFKPHEGEDREDRQTAVNMAVADRELLVKPGATGIGPDDVPFTSKVQEVDEEYYKKHLTRQTSRKALGYYQPKGRNKPGRPVYTKIQVAKSEGDRYKFDVHPDLRRADDDSESEMSDIEDMAFTGL